MIARLRLPTGRRAWRWRRAGSKSCAAPASTQSFKPNRLETQIAQNEEGPGKSGAFCRWGFSPDLMQREGKTQAKRGRSIIRCRRVIDRRGRVINRGRGCVIDRRRGVVIARRAVTKKHAAPVPRMSVAVPASRRRLQGNRGGGQGYEGKGCQESGPAREAVESRHDEPPKSSASLPHLGRSTSFQTYTRQRVYSCADARAYLESDSWRNYGAPDPPRHARGESGRLG